MRKPLYSTSIRWVKSKSENCCMYCEGSVKRIYIATGHDHTDYEYDLCSCEGARKTGKPESECK